MSIGDLWTARLPQDDPRMPHQARTALDAAAKAGCYLDVDQRDRIIRAAGANPADFPTTPDPARLAAGDREDQR